jgi:hypothetical protein
MLYSAFRMTVHLALSTFAAMLIVTAATPALAIDGRTAVGVCIDSTASGAWSVNDSGEIDICNKSGCVYCKSATDQCTAAAKGRPHPTRPLPVGATVKTSVLEVEITGKPFVGPILGFRCPEGLLPCPGHGCQPKDNKCTPVQ